MSLKASSSSAIKKTPQFVSEGIHFCIEKDPNYFYENIDGPNIYNHGLKCTNIRIKPATYDNDNEIKFHSEARKNHLNYFASIIYALRPLST